MTSCWCVLARHQQPAGSRAQLWKAYGKDPLHGETLNDLIRGLASEDSLAKAVELVALRSVPGWRGRGEIALGVLRAEARRPGGRGRGTGDCSEHGAEQRILAESRHRRYASCWPEIGWLWGNRLWLDRPSACSTIRRLSGSWPAPNFRRASRARTGPATHDPLAHEPAPYVGAAAAPPVTRRSPDDNMTAVMPRPSGPARTSPAFRCPIDP